MMMIKTIKSGKAHSFWLLLPVMLFLLSGCSKESSEDPEPGSTYAPVKFSLDIVSPEMGSTLLASVADGGQIDTRFYSYMNEGASKTILVRQEGKIIKLGSSPVAMSNTSGTEGRIEIDGTDKVSPNKPYDVFVLGCNARWDEGGVYYEADMSRGGSFGTWLKFSSSYRPSKATSNIAGTGEILFVINKSGAPIKFKHKGFDAEKKWYYKYAEVSMDNGKVVASEDGEVEGVETDVPVFTGSNARGIYSIYVPNGNKIQDAQLIAEIDGVEVRSTNRISSDIMIQQNQSYAMFAVWDGEKLMLGDGEGDPVVIVCSGDAASGIIVNEVRSDGTVVLSANSTTIPKVGEIIVSGVTAAAPRGFLYHVESVQQSGGQVIIKTSPAYLNELLPNAHLETKIPLGEAVEDQSSPFLMNGATRAKDFELLNKTWEITVGPKTKSDITLSGALKLGLELGGTFYYDSEYGIPQRCGIELEGSAFAKFVVELAAKVSTGEVPFNIWDQELATITLWIGMVPVCLTPHIVVDATIEASSKLYLKWTPLDAKWKVDAHLIWSKEPNLVTGENWDWGANCDNPLDGSFWKKMWSIDDLTDFELGLSGEVKLAAVPKVQLRLFDMENCRIDIGLSPYVKAEGELALKYQHDSGTSGDFHDDFELKDNLSFSVGMEVPLEGKLEFKIPFSDSTIGGVKSKKLQIFEVPLVEGASFFPVFNDFHVYPEDNVKQYTSIHVSAMKGAQLFTFFSGKETDFGFCYAPLVKDDRGNEVAGEWVYISLRDKYAIDSSISSQFEMETDILTHNLSSGTTYEVRPYTTVGQWGVVRRKGGKIKTGGSVSGGGGTIIDIPGENLNK